MLHLRRLLAPGTLALLVLTATPHLARAQLLTPGPDIEAYGEAQPVPGPSATAPDPALMVLSRDAQRGVPTVIRGARTPLPPWFAAPELQARVHLQRIAPLYGLSGLDTLVPRVLRTTASGGAVLMFDQSAHGLPVHERRITLLLDARGGLVGAGGQLAGAIPREAPEFMVDEATAVAIALLEHFPDVAQPSRPPVAFAGNLDAGYQRFTRTTSGAAYPLEEAVRVRRVLYELPTGLVPAHYLELWTPDENGASSLFSYVIHAGDGTLLSRRTLTQNDAFDYRVFADDAFQPFDGAFGDTTPDAVGAPISFIPPFTTTRILSVESLNTPPAGMVDAWLPDDATVSTGNNVDAYADFNLPSGFTDGDLRASTTGPNVFDHAYDPSLNPTETDEQIQAAITHLFYMNNWLHDVFYDVGFDEAAGNAQTLNFGRGGVEDDVLRAEGMDAGGRNNANMSTPADGASPRMQMFQWDAGTGPTLTVGGDDFDTTGSAFGPGRYDVSGLTALVDDGVGTATDGCEEITTNLTGLVALIDRGNCTFVQKVTNAEAAGAVAVIVMNNAGTNPFRLGGSSDTIDIPSTMVSQADGNTLRVAPSLGSTAEMVNDGVNSAAGSFDSQIVAHEWGHYIHRRLVPCGNRQCGAMSEGWADYVSLLALLRDGDDLQEAYPVGSFALSGRNPLYFGVRRVPYSPNRSFNALSFRHISNGEALPTTHPLGGGSPTNSQVHNSGEIWATMMFDATVALFERRDETPPAFDFEEAWERMASYVVTGMQLTPPSPTYTEQRDGVILAALERDPEDARVIAEAFASRGAGTCAVSPERFSTDFTGLTEDFELRARPEVIAIDVAVDDKDGVLCDADGLVDAGEDGILRVTVRNTGVQVSADIALEIGVDAPLTFVGGPIQTLTGVPAGDAQVLTYRFSVADPAAIEGDVTFTATLTGTDLCEGQDASRTLVQVMDRDFGARDTEDFQVRAPWLSESSVDGRTTGVWSEEDGEAAGERVLRAIDSSSLTDTAVELPDVVASANESLVLSFEHRYQFEVSQGTFWDGAVVEISNDRGVSWQDVEAFDVDAGYDGALTDRSGNPLALRAAYAGQSEAWPALAPVTLDFGTALAGETVRFRLRVGTDQSVGGFGWEIDNIVLQGTETPAFPVVVPDEGDCAGVPTADAGPDQTVFGGDLVTLDGTGSSDPDGDPLSYAWTLLTPQDGFALRLRDPFSATPTFVAPVSAEERMLTFRLRVSDGAGSAPDQTVVTVLAGTRPLPDAGPPPIPDAGPPPMPDAGVDQGPPPMPDAGMMVTPMPDAAPPAVDAGMAPPVMMDPAGCGCRAVASEGGHGTAALFGLGLLGLALGVRRRRRR